MNDGFCAHPAAPLLVKAGAFWVVDQLYLRGYGKLYAKMPTTFGEVRGRPEEKMGVLRVNYVTSAWMPLHLAYRLQSTLLSAGQQPRPSLSALAKGRRASAG